MRARPGPVIESQTPYQIRVHYPASALEKSMVPRKLEPSSLYGSARSAQVEQREIASATSAARRHDAPKAST